MSGQESFGRRMFGASSLVMLSSLAIAGLSILSSPITTRLLAPEAYGASASIGVTTNIFTIFALFGVDMGYARFALQGNGQGEEVERLCWRIAFMMSGVGALVAYATWVFALAPVLGLARPFATTIALSVALGVLGQFAMTRLRLLGSYRRMAIAIVVGGIVATGSTISIARFLRRDAWALVVGGAIGLGTQVLLQGTPSIRALLRRPRLDRGTIRQVLLMGLPALATTPGYWIVTSSDRWLLTRLSGELSTGLYVIAFNLAMIGTRFSSAMNIVWYPEISRALAEKHPDLAVRIGRQWTRFTGLLCLIWLATTAAGGDVIRILTPPVYHPASALVPWIAAGSLFYGVTGLSGTGMYVTGRVRPVAWWWVLGSAVSLGANRLLIPPLGPLAAAIVLPSAMGIIGVGIFVSSQAQWRMQVAWRDVIYIVLIVLVAGIATARPWAPRPILSLLIKFPVGVAVSTVVMWRLAPQWCSRGWDQATTAVGRLARRAWSP